MQKLEVLQKQGSLQAARRAIYKSPPPGEFMNWGLFIKFKGLLCGDPTEKRGKFNTKFLAARQFISPIQAPWLCAASKGLQERKKYNTSSIYTVKILKSFPEGPTRHLFAEGWK